MYLAERAKPVGGPLLAHMDRRQKARPQRLCPYPRGMRGEAPEADHRDENRARGAEAAKGGGNASDAGAGEGEEERSE